MTKRAIVLLAAPALLSGLLVGSAPASAWYRPAAHSTPVVVTAGRTTAKIDAALRTGGSISGRVVDADTHKPVASIYVGAYGSGGGGSADEYTDSDGRYTIGGVPPSSKGYLVCFQIQRDPGEPAAYASACAGNVPWDGGLQFPKGASRIKISGQQHRTGVNAELHRSAAISGRVTTAYGHPLESVSVSARSLTDPTLVVFDRDLGTDRRGRYYIDALPPSPKGYAVCFNATNSSGGSSRTGYGGQCYKKSAPVRVRSGRVHTGINAALTHAGAISGTVTGSPGGKPLRDVDITLFNNAGKVVRQAITRPDGRFSVVGLPASSSNRVCASMGVAANRRGQAKYLDACFKGAPWPRGAAPPKSAAKVRVVRKKTHAGIDIAMPAGGSIAGTVTSAATGAPIANADVFVINRSGRLQNNISNTTDAHGRYRVAGLAKSAAGYLVCVSRVRAYQSAGPVGNAPMCFGNATWNGDPTMVPRHAKRVPLALRQHRAGVNVALPAGGAISGHVRAADVGTLLSDLQITVYDHAGHFVIQAATRPPHGHGKYTVAGLAPSSAGYTVCFGGYADPAPARHDPYVGQCYSGVTWPH
jgi:Carboxypeptidase regulatory-like domain